MDSSGSPRASRARAVGCAPRRALGLGASGALGLLGLGLLGLVGCGADGGTVEDTDAVTGTTGSSTPDGYPEGPYGADIGETLPNLVWEGFVAGDGNRLASAEPYGPYTLDDARRSGKRYALLHFGAVF